MVLIGVPRFTFCFSIHFGGRNTIIFHAQHFNVKHFKVSYLSVSLSRAQKRHYNNWHKSAVYSCAYTYGTHRYAMCNNKTFGLTKDNGELKRKIFFKNSLKT